MEQYHGYQTKERVTNVLDFLNFANAPLSFKKTTDLEMRDLVLTLFNYRLSYDV